MANLNVLAMSYLFPNPEQPNHGLFVFNRLNALARYVTIKVINPIPCFPLFTRLKRYRVFEQIPYRTTLGNLEVYHPRFFSVPKVCKGIEILTYHHAVMGVLKRDLTNYPFNLVDLHWTFPDLPSGSRIAQLRKIPLIATVRGLEAFHEQDPGIRKYVVKKCLRNVNRVVALSEKLRQVSIRAGVAEDQSIVIRNGVDTQTFTYQSMQDARNRLNIASDERVILMVGSLIFVKGFDLVIKAIPAIRKALSIPVKLYILGSKGPAGDFSNNLFRLVKKLGLEDVVVFKGAVNNAELPDWYNAADVFCLASRSEGSPNVLTEALACGCPAVATDVGAVKEILSCEPDLGICIPSESVDKLADALRDALALQNDRVLRAERFRKYDWDWCAQQVLGVYQSAYWNRHNHA